MALPELPDDRRARPQRFAPGGPPGSRHAVRTPPGGAERVPPPPVLNGRSPDGSAQANGGSAHGVLPVNGVGPANGVAPVNGVVPVNGAAPVHGSPVAGPVGNGHRPGAGAAPRWDASPIRTGDRARPLTVPPQRGPDPDDEPTIVHDDLDDEPTVVHPAITDAPAADEESGAIPEFPGRHRRRAGQSPNSRPAAEYRAQADAARTGKKPQRGRRRRENFWRELPLLIVVALLMTFLIQTFLAKVYVIPSGSMEQTLHGCTNCNNDRVLVDKVSKLFVDPQPGDVVVFRGPDSWTNTEFSVPESDNPLVNGLQQFGSLIGLAPPDEKDFVKRVIAVGGQTVRCCDSRNRVMVDDEPLDEPYVYYLPERGPRQDPFDPVLVPEGQLWMMGDSRNNSADSREPGHGPVPIENVIGQARLIVLPFTRFGWISSVDPQPDDAVGMASLTVGAGTPLAMGLFGTLPFALWRRRRTVRDDRFLP